MSATKKQYEVDANLKLVDISLEELQSLREENEPHVLIKELGDKGTRYWVGGVERGYRLTRSLQFHLCGNCTKLSPLKCEKVRCYAQFIERFPFILRGCETLGVENTEFHVFECLHFERYKKEETSIEKTEQFKKDKYSLALFYFDGDEKAYEAYSERRRKKLMGY